MLYTVTIELLNAMYFVTDRPDDNEWEVQEGVTLEMYPLYGTWTPDLGPLKQILCVSTSDPKYYRVFFNAKDISSHGYRPTGRRFGGLFPKPTWERFAKLAPARLAILRIGDAEPLEVPEEVLIGTKEGT